MSHSQAPLRTAIIGCGKAATAHAEALAAHPDTTLVACVDTAAPTRRRFADTWGCAAVPSVKALLGTTKLDAAVLCTPTATHAELTRQLLSSGVDVLCVGPAALTSLEAGQLVEAARANGRVLMGASPLRFEPDLRELLARTKAGAIGRPVLFEITRCMSADVEGTWRVDSAQSGGGVLFDLGAQALGVLLEITDAPIRGIVAAFAPRTLAMDVEDTAELQVRTELGTLGRISLSWRYASAQENLIVVHGTEGTARMDAQGVHVRRCGESEWATSGGGLDAAAARQRELDAFLECRRTGEDQRCCGTLVPVLDLIERAYESERSGNWTWRTVQTKQVARI